MNEQLLLKPDGLRPARRSSDPHTSRTPPRRGSIAVTLLEAYAVSNDLTDEEAVECITGRPITLGDDGIRRRASDLRSLGWIAGTGETRTNRRGTARIVCAITANGRTAWSSYSIVVRPPCDRRTAAEADAIPDTLAQQVAQFAPLPWRIGVYDDDTGLCVIAADGKRVMRLSGTTEIRPASIHVVRACNSHDSLLEALQEMLSYQWDDPRPMQFEQTRIKARVAIELALRDAMATAIIEQPATAKSYAHMCRMDHAEIGYNDSGDDERCPLCQLIDERVAIELALRDG